MDTSNSNSGGVDAAMPVHDALFTCRSCSIAFTAAEDQREHYRSDFHRYNMQRRVASLPPVTVSVFRERVLEKRAESSQSQSPKSWSCEVCRKSYTTENAYKSHVLSKKHRENAELQPLPPASDVKRADPLPTQPSDAAPESLSEADIDAEIAAAESLLDPYACLFCASSAPSLALNLTHMSSAHSFFVPDADFLVDLEGLVRYLRERIVLEHVCVFCDDRGRAFRSADACRKHMVDKGHCKMAYDADTDWDALARFYDWTRAHTAVQQKLVEAPDAEEVDWEVVSGGAGSSEAGAQAEEPPSSEEIEGEEDEDADAESDDSDDLDLTGNAVVYDESNHELVLASGARLGHKTKRPAFAQPASGRAPTGKEAERKEGVSLVRKLLTEKNSALVPRKGGFGAYGRGYDVVKARNAGEAWHAGQHVREFKDQKRKRDFQTKVGFIANHQKHFYDPILGKTGS